MERISVAIRVRPPTKEELVKGNHWVIEENKVTLCNCYGAPLSGYSYAFDRLFKPESNNADVYEIHAKEVVLSAMRGFNGTVFAYGQTSSGKTYTMQGNDEQPGIIPLAVRDVFNSISKTGDREFLVRVSYMEIYNEEINDLLAPENRKLQIHENLEKGVFVAGLREEIVNTPDQVYDFLKLGEAHRHFAETNMNLYSSRSHTIFRMVIESREKNRDTDAVRVSTLSMVDLAGSERVAKTGAGGVRLKEGGHINKSLMTLGTVINKLSEGTGKGVHIPYRDSKVTRILQPALDGNAKTAIICTITPDEIHIDETRGTLQFASRAKKVATCAHVNEILTDAAVLKRQKKEIEELRQKLLGLRSDDFEKQLLKLRNDLLKYELEKEKLALELEEERKTQVERERKIKEQEQRIENLSTLVLNSARDDRDHLDVKMVARRETWSPLKVMPDATTKDYFRSPLARIDSSLISTRRNKDKSVTPLQAFEALLEHDDDTLDNGPSAPNGNTELSVALQPEKDSDEDTWMHSNGDGANVADEDTWTRLNDDEWASLNSEAQIVSTSHEYTPCVKSDKIDLLEFQLKELQVQLEELQHRYSCKDAEAADLKRDLDISLEKYEETVRQLDEMRKANCNLHELNLQLDSERCAQERRVLDTEQQKSQILANNDQLIKKLADLQAENALGQRQLEELKDANHILDRDAFDTKIRLNEVTRDKERSEEQLASLLSENSVLRDENRRLDSQLSDSHLEKQQCVKQLDDLEKQLHSLLAENSHLQESKENLEAKVQFHEGITAQAKEELQQQLLINTNLTETNKDLDSLVQTARLQEQQAMQLVTDTVAEKERQLHELEARITAIQEQHRSDQECLIERLRMSEQHISVLDEQLSEVRAQRDRLSGIVSVQVERNQEILTAMRLERMRVAGELSKYLGALTCQQDSISAVCSGINSIVQA